MKREIYQNIMQTLAGAIYTFTSDNDISPNRIYMSADIINFLGCYIKEETTYSLRATNSNPTIKIMGIEVEEVPYTSGLIEVGYVYRVPYRINTEYRGDHE